MKVVNYAAYTTLQDKVAGLRPAHREYMARLHADGRLVACGPYTDGSGELFIYDTPARSPPSQQILADGPYQIAVVFESARLCPWEIMKANPALIPRCDEEPSAHVDHAYGAEEAGPEDRACLRRAGLLGEAFEHDSGVVHQDIDRAAAVEDLVDTSPSDLSERTRAQPSASTPGKSASRCRRCREHPRAAVREEPCGRLPNAGRGTCTSTTVGSSPKGGAVSLLAVDRGGLGGHHGGSPRGEPRGSRRAHERGRPRRSSTMGSGVSCSLIVVPSVFSRTFLNFAHARGCRLM